MYRHTLAVLMLLALMLQALIPAGFMPSFSAAGKVAVVICSGLGGKNVLVDAPGKQQTPAPQDHDDQSTCPYVATTAPGILTLPAFIIPPAAQLVSDFTEVKDQIVLSLYDASHAPRGPPEYV